MALENGAELAGALRRPDTLGRAFARHAHGMRAWAARMRTRPLVGRAARTEASP